MKIPCPHPNAVLRLLCAPDYKCRLPATESDRWMSVDASTRSVLPWRCGPARLQHALYSLSKIMEHRLYSFLSPVMPTVNQSYDRGCKKYFFFCQKLPFLVQFLSLTVGILFHLPQAAVYRVVVNACKG